MAVERVVRFSVTTLRGLPTRSIHLVINTQRYRYPMPDKATIKTCTLYCAACRRERFIHELEEDSNGFYMCKGACPTEQEK
jgi:hypothetical protein